MEAQPKGSADTVRMLRLWILGVLVLGLLGTVVELKAPPLLAPGMMMQLGLLGLAYVYSDKRYRRS